MARQTKKRVYRAFLVPPRQGADSYVKVTIQEDDIDLKIADCTRSISLDFTAGSNSWNMTKKQALAKLAKMEKALGMIREAIEASND